MDRRSWNEEYCNVGIAVGRILAEEGEVCLGQLMQTYERGYVLAVACSRHQYNAVGW